MKKLFDVQLPFFIPLWRRVALVVFTTLWAGVELSLGNTVWAVGFVILAAYLAHQFFFDWNPKEPDESGE